jgi:hypothetical protein
VAVVTTALMAVAKVTTAPMRADLKVRRADKSRPPGGLVTFWLQDVTIALLISYLIVNKLQLVQ